MDSAKELAMRGPIVQRTVSMLGVLAAAAGVAVLFAAQDAAALKKGSRPKAPSPVALQLPQPEGSLAALFTLDRRQLDGEGVVTHVDVMPDGRTTCARRDTDGTLRSGSWRLADSDLSTLAAVADQGRVLQAKQVPRTVPGEDDRVTTLVVRDTIGQVTLISDALTDIVPSQGVLVYLLQLAAWQCLQEAPRVGGV